MKKRIFVDMDGVLAEYKEDASISDMMEKGYFRSLRPRTEMVDAIKYLIGSDNADVYILSAVFGETRAESIKEKNEWLDEFIPEIDQSHRIFTIVGESKADAVNGITENDYLFDDFSGNLKNWVSNGGKGIKIINEINGKNGTFTEGIRLKINGERDLLLAVNS